jgi:multidrug resistance efflux pump
VRNGSRHAFRIAVFLALAAFVHAQTSRTAELEKLRNEYVSATKDYIVLLEKQKPGLVRSVRRAEDQLEKIRHLYSESLVSSNEVEASQKALTQAKAKITEIDEAIANANKRIQELPTVAELEREARKVKRTSRRRSAGDCSNWTLKASRRETKSGVTLAWKLVCAR